MEAMEQLESTKHKNKQDKKAVLSQRRPRDAPYI